MKPRPALTPAARRRLEPPGLRDLEWQSAAILLCFAGASAAGGGAAFSAALAGAAGALLVLGLWAKNCGLLALANAVCVFVFLSAAVLWTENAAAPFVGASAACAALAAGSFVAALRNFHRHELEREFLEGARHDATPSHVSSVDAPSFANGQHASSGTLRRVELG